MPTNLKGKAVLVTGGAAGIGRATALRFAECGAKVAVSDVADESGIETVQIITDRGGEGIFIRSDVSDELQVKALIRQVVNSFGGLDYAHNNAGVMQNERVAMAEYPEAEWHRIIEVNLSGTWLCMKYEIPELLKAGGGGIVNTSSLAGITGVAGASAYTASKFGVVGLTQSAALEYAASGIRVNAVCPGHILTPMVEGLIRKENRDESMMRSKIPMQRLGTSEDIAKAVVWLCADAPYVTGQSLSVDGGLGLQVFPPIESCV